jgi:hypothetical protein
MCGPRLVVANGEAFGEGIAESEDRRPRWLRLRTIVLAQTLR